MYINKYGIGNLLRLVFNQNISKPVKNRPTRLPYGLIFNLLLTAEQTFQPCVWGVHSTDLVGFFALTFTTTLHIIRAIVSVR